jgi:hypothetical protein
MVYVKHVPDTQEKLSDFGRLVPLSVTPSLQYDGSMTSLPSLQQPSRQAMSPIGHSPSVMLSPCLSNQSLKIAPDLQVAFKLQKPMKQKQGPQKVIKKSNMTKAFNQML